MSEFLDEVFGDGDDHEHDECFQLQRKAQHKIMEAMQHLAETPCTVGQMGELLPSRFVLIAEHMDATGERWVSTCGTEAMEPWDADGLVSWAGRQVARGSFMQLPA